MPDVVKFTNNNSHHTTVNPEQKQIEIHHNIT